MKSGVSLKTNLIHQQCRQIAFYFLKTTNLSYMGKTLIPVGAKE